MGNLLETLAAPFRALGGYVGSLISGKARKGGDRTPEPSDGERFFAQLLQSFGYLGSGPGGWSQDRALQVTKFRHWVYCGIRAIMEEIASQPVQLAWRRSPDQAEVDRQRGKAGKYVPKRLLSTRTGNSAGRVGLKDMARLQGNEELELAPHDHKLLRLLHKPNPFDTYETLWQKMELYGDLTGNIYLWEAAHDRLGHPVELWVLPSHWVYRAQQTQEQIDRGELVSGFEVRPYGVRARTNIILPAADVIHLPYPHPMTPLDGYSPLTAGAEWIDTMDAIDTARFSAMKQGIWPGLILSLMPEVADPDPETMGRLRARFRQHFQGEDKFGKPLVLGPGMKVDQATRAPTDMDFVNGSDQLRDWVLSLLRVPKAVLGITAEVNRASMDAASANFARWCIKPKLRFIDGMLTEKLARRYDESLILFHEDPTPDDPAGIALEVQTRAQHGAITPNEIRALYGDEPYDHGGDDPLVPPTLVPLPINTGDAGGVGMGGAGAGGQTLDELIAGIQGLRKPVGEGTEEEGEEGAEGDDKPAKSKKGRRKRKAPRRGTLPAPAATTTPVPAVELSPERNGVCPH